MEIQYALLYFLRDKDFSIYHVSEVKGFSEESIQKLHCREKVILEAEWDGQSQPVRVLQVSKERETLKETSMFCASMKKKKHPLEEIVGYFKPIRNDIRQRLPPHQQFHPLSEDSTAYFSSSPEKYSSPKKSRSSHVQSADCGRPVTSTDELLLPELPSTSSRRASNSSVISTQKKTVFGQEDVLDSLQSSCPMMSSTPKRKRATEQEDITLSSVDHNVSASIKSLYNKYSTMCRAEDIELNSNSGNQFFLCALLRENMLLKTEVNRIAKQLNSLQCMIAGSNTATPSLTQDSPVFATADAYMATENHPTNMVAWMKKEGGSNLREHISRVMKKLLSQDLQERINRPGLYGKMSFHNHLENQIKDSAMHLFPGTSFKEIECQIARFLNGAKDRNGGREERRQRQRERQQSPDRHRTVIQARRRNVIVSEDSQSD